MELLDPILPQEPGNNSYQHIDPSMIAPQEPQWQISKSEMERAQLAEMIGAMMEDIVAEDEAENFERFPNRDDPTRIGRIDAPPLLEGRLPIVDTPRNRQAVERLFVDEIVPEVRREWVEAIVGDNLDEFVYLPEDSLTTRKSKQKQGYPDKPLYKTGEFAYQMAVGYDVQVSWEQAPNIEPARPGQPQRMGERIRITWGRDPRTDPKTYESDILFGKRGTGRGHKVNIPPRYPHLSTGLMRSINSIIRNFIEGYGAGMLELPPGPDKPAALPPGPPSSLRIAAPAQGTELLDLMQTPAQWIEID